MTLKGLVFEKANFEQPIQTFRISENNTFRQKNMKPDIPATLQITDIAVASKDSIC